MNPMTAVNAIITRMIQTQIEVYGPLSPFWWARAMTPQTRNPE